MKFHVDEKLVLEIKVSALNLIKVNHSRILILQDLTVFSKTISFKSTLTSQSSFFTFSITGNVTYDAL